MFKVLSSFKDNRNSPYLSQLLLRLDYNRFFSGIGAKKDSFMQRPLLGEPFRPGDKILGFGL